MTFPSAQSVTDLLSLPAPDLVCRSFQLLLGRPPSSSEQKARERSLHLGCGRIAMIAEIHQSAEANEHRRKRRELGSDMEFIEGLYQNYIGRSAEPDGLAHYMDLIQRKGRTAVEADIAASREAVDHHSLPYELERLVRIHRRSRQWWRWFGRSWQEQQIRNIESEANAVRIAHQAARQPAQIISTREVMREDMQAPSDRRAESHQAEQAKAAPLPAIHTVDADRLGPWARQILQRMQTPGLVGGHF